MAFRAGSIKPFVGFSTGDTTLKRLKAVKVITDTLNVRKQAIMNNLDVNSACASRINLSGQLVTTAKSDIDINGTITLNNQIYVLTIEDFLVQIQKAGVNPGTSIVVGPGTFIVRSKITIPEQTDIIGSGENTTIFKAADNLNDPVFCMGGDDISISQLQVDANGANQDLSLIYANVDVIGVSRIIILNCKFTNLDVDPPVVTFKGHIKLETVTSVRIINCTFGPEVRSTTTGGVLFNVSTSSGNIDDVQISNCRQISPNGFMVLTPSFGTPVASQGKITKFSLNNFNGVDAIATSGIVMSQLVDAAFVNNNFGNQSLSFSGFPDPCEDIIVVGNQWKESRGLLIQFAARNIVVSQNIFDGFREILVPSLPLTSDPTIIGGSVNMRPLGFPQTNIKICNNIIRNPRPSGINFDPSITSVNNVVNVLITDNVITRNNTVRVNINNPLPLDPSGDPLRNVSFHRSVGRNHSVMERTFGDITGAVDSNGTVFLTSNLTANVATSFLTQLQIGDEITVGATTTNIAAIANNFFIATTDTVPSGADQGINVDTYNPFNGYDDYIELITQDGTGLHDIQLRNIHPASDGHQLTIHLLSHGGTASDDVTITPVRTGIIIPTLTSSYTSATLDSANDYVVFEWTGNHWDIKANNGAVIA